MKCQLCGEEKVLLKKSHIIPDFMYKGLFDEKHRIVLADLNNLKRIKSIPTGIYDANLLCIDCDGKKIGALETYASKALYGGELPNNECPIFSERVGPDGIKSLFIENISYNKFKLFLLSILWRAHHSKNKFFKDVDLGVYANKIRDMILNNNAKDESDFQTMVLAIRDCSVPLNTIISPRKLKENNNTSYVIYINGVFYHFNISKYSKASIFSKGYISKNNTMEAAILEGSQADKYFHSYVGKKHRLKNKINPNL